MNERLERIAPGALLILLVVTWLIAVGYMWTALVTIPSADRLEQTRMVAIPTPRTVLTAVTFSAMELGVVILALWPRWTGYWATRLAVVLLALVTWFIMTTTMDVSRMDWVHRRWLASTILLIMVALLVLLGYRLWRRVAGGIRPAEPGMER